jgi:hypothetical protein
MSAYFKGWRRKVGCITLVIALATCAGWVRSRIVLDRLVHYTPKAILRVTSSDSTFWVEEHRVVEGPVGQHWPGVSFRWVIGLRLPGIYSPYEDHSSPTFKERPWRHRSRFAGFDVGEFEDTYLAPLVTTYRCRVWGVPYWSMVVPLTLLSVFLLLSNRGTRIAVSRPLVRQEECREPDSRFVNVKLVSNGFPLAERLTVF